MLVEGKKKKEAIDVVVNNKKDLADYLIDGKENPAFMSELRDIITKL